MARRSKPDILANIESVRASWQSELWMRERFCKGRNRDQKLRHAQIMIARMNAIEEWVRTHMNPAELEEMLA